MNKRSRVAYLMLVATLFVALTCTAGFARDKNETIDATAYGTSTQLGRNVGITLIIYEYSTPEDRQILVRGLPEGPEPGLGECAAEDEGGRPHSDSRHARLRLSASSA